MNDAQDQYLAPPLYPGRPLVGSLFELTRDRLGFIDKLSRFSGVARFRMFNLEIYQLSSPEAVQHVLQDNARNYIKGSLFDPLRRLAGNGLFLSEGDFWLRQRRLMQPAFHHRRLEALVEGMAAETQASVERWAQAAARGQVVNMAEETTSLAMRVVTRALFSTGLNRDQKQLADAITVLLEDIAFRFEMPFYPPLGFPTPRNRRTQAAMRKIDDLVYDLISQRRAAQETKDDLLSMLMEARDEEDGSGMTDRQLRDEALIMFAAGHETTANAMAWAFYEIQRSPVVMERLRAEVDSVLGGRRPAAGDLRRLVYTRMVVEESLRLYPPIYITNRQAVEDDTVCGFIVPAGALVSVTPYSVQRDPRYWDEPESFNPENFSPEAAQRRPRYAYFPFGGGPRQCIGKDFALFEAVVVLAIAVQRFNWRLVPGTEVRHAMSVTYRPDAVMLEMEERA